VQQTRGQGPGEGTADADGTPAARRRGPAFWWGTAAGTAVVLSLVALAVWFATGAERVVGAPVESWSTGATAADRSAAVELVAVVESGGCLHEERVTVRETADRVELSGSARMPGGQVACTADIRYEEVAVRLAQPLGDRVVVTPAGDEIPERSSTVD